LGGIWLLAQEYLSGHNAPLMVYAHQETEKDIEKNPDSGPDTQMDLVLW
jgi:hypothetical protein